MPSPRSAKLASVIQRHIATAIQSIFREEKFGLLTVTNVEVSRGNDSVKVFVSCLKNSHQFEEVAATHISTVQAYLNSQMAMKKVPKIIFQLDRTSELTAKLDRLLD